jgi:hypothetical protein
MSGEALVRKQYLYQIWLGVLFAGPLCGSLNAQSLSISPKLIPNQAVSVSSTGPSHQITLNHYYSATVNISSIQVSAPFSPTNNCGPSIPGSWTFRRTQGHFTTLGPVTSRRIYMRNRRGRRNRSPKGHPDLVQHFFACNQTA